MSFPWSGKGFKATPVNADEILIIDSEDSDPETENKRITLGSLPSGSGEANTSSNSGTGEGLAQTKVGVDLPFKSLLGETSRIILTGNTDDVTFTLDSVVVTTDKANTYGAFPQIFQSNEFCIEDLISVDTFQFVASELTAGNIQVILPQLIVNDTFVFENFAQVLANKTLTDPIITNFSNATHDHSSSSQGGQLTNSALISGVFSSITGLGTQTQDLNMNTNSIENSELPTDTNFFVDSIDDTKKLAFGLSGFTTITTRTVTVPDSDGTLVFESLAQTLTNKTLTLPIISAISNTGTLTLPTSTDTLVGRNTTDTLTNKTLTLPIISSISNIGTLTLPTSTDTLVGRATTDIFTNKTFDANDTGNSLSNVDVEDLADGTAGELITWDNLGVADTVSTGTSTQVLTSNGAGLPPTFQSVTISLPVVDSTSIVKGDIDPDKQIRFEVDGFAAPTTRVITPPDADITLINTSNGFITNTNLSSGVFSNITGIGTQSQNLNMNTSNRIVNLADPTSAQDGATKNYVDTFIQGLVKWKEPVRVATIGSNITLAGEQTIDGILTSTDRILVKDQTLGEENGIYVTAAGVWSRDTDFDESDDVLNATMWVSEGSINADQGFVCTTDLPITLGVTSLAFVQFSGLGQITTGTNLSKTANTINFDPSGGVTLSGNDLTNTGTITINNPLDTFQYIITPNAITVNRIANLPVLTADDTFVFEDATQTLTNKTISAASNNISITEVFMIAASDEVTPLLVDNGITRFRMPYAFTITEVRASLTTAGTGAALLTIDINESATTILSTKITIDANETTSTTATTPPVVSDTSLADDAEISIDIQQIDTDGVSAGLKVYIIGFKT